MDSGNQLGKILRSNRNKTDIASKRAKQRVPRIERMRDIMDKVVPFTMEFKTIEDGHRVILHLNIFPPPQVGCCADCSCSICEFFDGGLTETVYNLTYAYVPGTVMVFKNNIPITEFIESNPATGEVTVWAHTTEKIIICYVYDTCI